MARRGIIVIGLLVVEVLVCIAIIVTLVGSRTWLSGVRFFYFTDTYVEEVVEESFRVDRPATLDVSSLWGGGITVTGGDGNMVEVTATQHLWGEDEEDARGQLEVTMAQEGNRITIRVTRPEGAPHGYLFANIRGSWVDFEIRVPRDTSVVLDTSSGAITLEGISDGGDLVAETDFGDVTVRDVVADSLTARSSSGELRLETAALDGPLDMETDFGSIHVVGAAATSYRLHSSSGALFLDGCRGTLDLQTDFGDVEVRGGEEARLDLKTSSGAILFEGRLAGTGAHRVETDFGSVRLILPADTAVDLDAETDFGKVTSEFAIAVTLEGELDEDHWQGTINGGGPLLVIRTQSGDITLETSD